jgi:hypothetical protein
MHLEQEINANALTAFRWATAEIKGAEGVYRINGQHTSKIFSTKKLPENGTVVLEHYLCDSIDDVVSLWSRYDATFSSRTKIDVLNTAFESDQDLIGLPKKQSRAASAAIALIEHGFGSTNKVSHFDKAQSAKRNKDFVIWSCRMFTDKSPCVRVGVFVAAYMNFRESKELASTFWSEVQNGSNTDPMSASRALQRLLLEYSAGRGMGARNSKSLSWDQTAELSLSAWSNWRKGRKTHSLKLSKTGLDKFIKIPRGEYTLSRQIEK